MAVIPCGHRILVKPQKLEEVDDAYASARKLGIQIVDGNQKRLEQLAVDKGTVLAIGATAFKDFGGEAWCEVGDTIVYARHGGKLIKDPETNEEVLLLNDEDVIAKLENTKHE